MSMFVPRPWYVASLLAPWLCLAAPLPTLAQITPDATLGAEGSVVTPEMVQGAEAELIEGGAVRDGNLFHSFLEFNIDDGQRVYFANPAGIESILSRVTGGNPSNIFGTLGVDGAADLFLINPNGIVFGENATLDIQGSFYASTAEAIPLGDGIYSATEPEQSSLLTVHPSALFSNYLSDASGDIQNRGQLAAQGNLTLAANNLDLQGQVAAGGDLTLLGLDTVQIRDRVDAPFVGFAGGALLVQGNESVDIVALSHADSGLYSYGDMVLRSGNPVGGDAHYWSGGSFRVENLDGEAGGLFSPIDPIIRSFGDVVIDQYEGRSLHISAGGSVSLGTATITGADAGTLDNGFLREAITLSDGTVVQVDGGAQPTLDVRAGVRPDVIGTAPLAILTGFDPSTDAFTGNAFVMDVPSTADITVGDVFMAAPDGLVLLTNQYQPNTTLSGGNIVVTGEGLRGIGIDARGFGGQGGAVYLDARNDVLVTNSSIDTTGAGTVGDVVINAGDTVRFEQQTRRTVAASNLEADATGTGGNIRITAKNVELLGGAQLSASTFGTGDAGDVVIQAGDRVVFEGTSTDGQFSSGAFSTVEAGAEGDGGNVEIMTNSLEVLNGAALNASTFGTGDAGNVVIQAGDRVVFEGTSIGGQSRSGAASGVGIGGSGSGGNVAITANSLEVLNGAVLTASTFGTGDAGDVVIQAGDFVLFSGGSEINSSTFGQGDAGDIILLVNGPITFDGLEIINGEFSVSGISSQVGNSSTPSGNLVGRGNGGNITLRGAALTLSNGASISADTFGQGNSGEVNIDIDGDFRISGLRLFDINDSTFGFSSGVSSQIGFGSVGNSLGISVNSDSLFIDNGGFISTGTSGLGNAGDLEFNVVDKIVLSTRSSINSGVQPGGNGRAGNINVVAQNLTLNSGSQIGSSIIRGNNVLPAGQGLGGNIQLAIEDLILIQGVSTQDVNVSDRFNPGSILSLEGFSSGVFVSTERGAIGSTGSVLIETGRLHVSDAGVINGLTSNTSDGGSIVINANDLALTGGGQIIATTRGAGQAGRITLNIREQASFSGIDSNFGDRFSRFGGDVVNNQGPESGVFANTSTESSGRGQDIRLNAGNLSLTDGATITSRSDGEGASGNIIINVDNALNARDSDISTRSLQAAGGAILINSGNVILRGDSDIRTNVESGAQGGGNINIFADFVIALDDSDIFAFSPDGRGGNIDLSRTTFFGQNANIGSGPLTREELLALDGNDRVDVNASGAVESGQIIVGDSSFIENSLTSLADTIIDTAALTAGSCIARTDDSLGDFVITGSGGLPQRPGDSGISAYPTGTVRPITEPTATLQEPDGVYQLPDGRLVLSHACE